MKAKSSLDVEFGPLEGVLLLDKPNTISSNGALQAVRRLFGRVKAGHTGTLDLLATGLLPICLRRGYKIFQRPARGRQDLRSSGWLRYGDHYRGRGRRSSSSRRHRRRHRAVTARFDQLPGRDRPAAADVQCHRYQGRPLYEYARAGKRHPARDTAGHDRSRLRCWRSKAMTSACVFAVARALITSETLAQDIGEKRVDAVSEGPAPYGHRHVARRRGGNARQCGQRRRRTNARTGFGRPMCCADEPPLVTDAAGARCYAKGAVRTRPTIGCKAVSVCMTPTGNFWDSVAQWKWLGRA